MKFLLFFLLFVVVACSFKKSNQTLKGHTELYSEPGGLQDRSLGKDETRIVIAATNDLHGQYAPQKISFKDKLNPETQNILIGGEKVMTGYFNILRKTFKNVILLDSGDIFSNGSAIDRVQAFYQRLNYDALTIGLRDFNLKVPSVLGSSSALIKEFAKNSTTPLLLSNLYELKTARGVEWVGTKSHLIKEVDGVKVGIIGLVPDDISDLTPVNNRVGLYVESMLEATLKHARLMRSLGADVIVVLTNQGLDCHSKLMDSLKLPASKVNFEPLKKNICDTKSFLGEYLLRLPPELVDVVIGGRTHEKMANIVNGVTVISGYPDGQSFSYTELVLNRNTRKINREKTLIHQPIFFCHEFFKETKDCYPEDMTVNHLNRIPATFLGEEIIPDTETNAWTKQNLQSFDISKKLIELEADISFHPKSSGETQLFMVKIPGNELMRLLEEDYNRGRAYLWRPSPFLKEKQEVKISIAGADLELNKVYRVLSDLESLQKHHFFLKKVSAPETTSFPTISWDSVQEDSVSTQMAAPMP
jgi:hypothetical protein